MEFFKRHPFSMTVCQIKKPGKEHQRNILRSSYMKFYPIWFRGCGEMASDGRTDGRTDKVATICSLFGEHENSSTRRDTGRQHDADADIFIYKCFGEKFG